MKRLILLNLCLVLVTGAVWGDPQKAPTILLQDMEAANFQEMGPHGVVLYVPKGSSLPLRLKLNGQVAAAESEEISLKFQHDILVYLSGREEEEPRFSLDGSQWKSWKETFRGSLSAGASNNLGASGLRLDLELNLR